MPDTTAKAKASERVDPTALRAVLLGGLAAALCLVWRLMV